MTESKARKFQEECFKSAAIGFIQGTQLEKEMLKLARFTKKEHPKFTAAGLFRINRKMFFALLSTFATYFIIFAQFNSKL